MDVCVCLCAHGVFAHGSGFYSMHIHVYVCSKLCLIVSANVHLDRVVYVRCATGRTMESGSEKG